MRQSWEQANRDFLLASLERLAALLTRAAELDGSAGEPTAPEEPEWTGDPACLPPLLQLCRRFELTRFERDVLLLTAAIEMDGRFAELCARCRGSGGARHPSFRLALSALPGGSWDALLPGAPLRRWELVRVEHDSELSTGRLRIDERIWQFLLGLSEPDPRLRRCLRPLPPGPELAPSHRQLAHALALTWAQALEGGDAPIVLLQGRSAVLQAAIADAATRELGVPLLRVPVDVLPPEGEAREAFVRAWQREEALAPCALLLDAHGLEPGEGAGESRRLARLLDELGGLLLVAGWAQPSAGTRQQLAQPVSAALPAEQRGAWQQALHALGVAAARDTIASDLVARFDLDLPAVHGAVALARSRLAAAPELNPALALWDACREQARQDLGGLAQRVVSRACWEDLSLPPTQLEQLHYLERCARQQYRVHHEWDFGRGSERGRGILALFSGPTGTGKTLAAEVLANALRLDLYRVDLSAVTSKWIGETEKHLRQVFDGAEAGGAMLLFDEADSLFGQRGEVREGRDRYANLEVNYLLQRMETFRGLAILTTNLRGNLDPAMQRRLRFCVDFSYPDARQREAIWQRVFPPATPTEGLDARRLAQLSASGADIHCIAWMAACLASAEQRAVNMEHVLRAARWEYQKTQRVLVAREVEGWVP